MSLKYNSFGWNSPLKAEIYQSGKFKWQFLSDFVLY